MTVWAIILSMIIVSGSIGGSIYIITKIIENVFCIGNNFFGLLSTFVAFIIMAAIALGVIYFIFVFAGYIEAILIAL